MRVLRTLVTGWLPGLLLAAAAPLRPEGGRHSSRAAVRVDDGAMKRSRLKRMAHAFLRACTKAQTSVACTAAAMLAAALLLFMAPASAQNLASGKTATQSSTYASDSASKAVDGNTNGNWSLGSVAITGSELNAWWQVDLGAVASIGRITIYNRTDCCGSRLNNADILVSSSPFPTRALNSTEVAAAKVATISAALSVNTFNLTAVTGRYLRVQLQGTEYLQLAEVEVLAATAGVQYLIVGGGGGGGGGATINGGGGGGAGGVAAGATTVSTQSIAVTVGAGGAGGTAGIGATGSASAFGSMTAGGGGGGGTSGGAGGAGGAGTTVGGSGGGGGRDSGSTTSGAKGSPAGNGTIYTYNNDGGAGKAYPWGSAGGGGGAGAAGYAGGTDSGTLSGTFSQGGVGITLDGGANWYGGGGGGAWQTGAVKAQGGQGGGGRGGNNNGAGTAGTANTGSGGGGGQFAAGGNGGSGVVVIRYKTDGSDGVNAATTTGGTKTTLGDYTVHTFTTSGTFTVATPGVEYLIVGGGGGGGAGALATNNGGGGGGGGCRTGSIGVLASTISVVVGAGGSGGSTTSRGSNGGDSQFGSIVAAGGGTGGGGQSGSSYAALAGGNGGGGDYSFTLNGAAGNTPATTPAQGLSGGNRRSGSPFYAGGGGGCGQAGSSTVGTGGNGMSSSISGTATTYGGGGAGAQDNGPSSGGAGGGGNGGKGAGVVNPTAGTDNLGGGGGGGSSQGGTAGMSGARGGSGVVIIRYKTDGSDGIDPASATGGTKTTSGIYTIHTFTASGTFTVSAAGAAPGRLQIEHASGTGLTCTPSTVTVRACADAACTTAYTSGVSGTLGATGGSVVWPATTAFSIPAGSSTTTVSLQSTTTTATVLGVASSTPSASNAATCNFGSPSCTFTAADAGFVFDVPNHVSEVSQTVSVSAVRKSDNATVCVPAFASASRNVTFSCSYTNPTTGTLPVRVGSTALNASASAAAACDAGGRAVSLAFNASGVASTAVQYADVGNMLLSARYTGSAGTGEAGLVMTGSDSFIAAPGGLTVSGITSGPIKAGSSFAATVSAVNSAGATTPNYGRETSPEGATLSWVRMQPSGSGAAKGSFSGSLGAFSGGSATASNLAWTEVGRGDLVARSTSTSGYLGSTLRAFGASPASGAVQCAVENGSCVVPGGTTATVYYGENGGFAAKAGQTGTVACSNGNFGDPLSGTSKRCWYVATSATNGSVGDFIPHRFTVAASNACGTFSYAGQPVTATVTARNAAGNTTVNFNGTATTTPSFAQAVTFADANGLGVGALSGASIAASAFSAGVASGSPSYSFTSKTTAPQSLVLRASNGASGTALVSSAGYAEPTLPLRSGRLRLSNAFGKATAALQVPVVTEYWGGSAWQLNSADSCTALAGASVALSNPRAATGAASAATSSAGAVAISGGNGILTLAAPSPAGSSLSLDLAVNLGSAGADQSCNASKPATTGAGLPWLRAQNGSCAATADRDPAARASFGIFSPETRKIVHMRDLY